MRVIKKIKKEERFLFEFNESSTFVIMDYNTERVIRNNNERNKGKIRSR